MVDFYCRVISLKEPFTEVRLAESKVDEEAMWTKHPEQLSGSMQRDRQAYEPEDFIYFLRATGDRLRRRILEIMSNQIHYPDFLAHTQTSPLTASIASMVPRSFGLEVPVHNDITSYLCQWQHRSLPFRNPGPSRPFLALSS